MFQKLRKQMFADPQMLNWLPAASNASLNYVRCNIHYDKQKLFFKVQFSDSTLKLVLTT